MEAVVIGVDNVNVIDGAARTTEAVARMDGNDDVLDDVLKDATL